MLSDAWARLQAETNHTVGFWRVWLVRVYKLSFLILSFCSVEKVFEKSIHSKDVFTLSNTLSHISNNGTLWYELLQDCLLITQILSYSCVFFRTKLFSTNWIMNTYQRYSFLRMGSYTPYPDRIYLLNLTKNQFWNTQKTERPFTLEQKVFCVMKSQYKFF